MKENAVCTLNTATGNKALYFPLKLNIHSNASHCNDVTEQTAHIQIQVCGQHVLLEGRRCCLSEVDDSRLILTTVMDQHDSAAKNQIRAHGLLGVTY